MTARTSLPATAVGAALASLAVIVTASPVPSERLLGRQTSDLVRPSDSGQTPGQALERQVRLQRAGFSPGEIDGVSGPNTSRAEAALQQSGRSLGADPVDVVVKYTITPADVSGPFTASIPRDLMRQASLPALNYSSPLEGLAERFHAAPELLRRLNPGATFVAGESILVPNVLIREARPAPDAGEQRPPVTLVVSKSRSSLSVLDERGATIFHAPVTSGSQHDPLPLGKWTVTAVSRRPTFHYNPDLFWDADPSHARAEIRPGPNNPVGLVWIDLDKPHYGIHGTPEPGKVGHTSSHGCVRLTNWDVSHVADLVRKGTSVVFEE